MSGISVGLHDKTKESYAVVEAVEEQDLLCLAWASHALQSVAVFFVQP